MDKIEKIKDWLKPYLKEDKVKNEHDEGFFHCAMLLNDFLDTLSEESNKNLDEQVEKDLALTINDLELLHTFLYAIKNNKQGCFTFTRLSDEQYEEILRRFNEAKQ